MILREKICPSCKKSNIELFIGGQTGSYVCKCGYIGPIVIEVEKTKKRKEKKKKAAKK